MKKQPGNSNNRSQKDMHLDSMVSGSWFGASIWLYWEIAWEIGAPD